MCAARDADRFRQHDQAFALQHDIGCGLCKVRGARRACRNMRRGKGSGIIDAVANHQRLPACSLQAFDVSGLGVWISLRPPGCNSGSDGGGGNRAWAIAGKQFHRQTKRLQISNRLQRIRAQPISEAEDNRRGVSARAKHQHHAIADTRDIAKHRRSQTRRARFQTLPRYFARALHQGRFRASAHQRLRQGVPRCARHARRRAQCLRVLAFRD